MLVGGRGRHQDRSGGDLVQDVYDLSYQLKDAATTSEILVEISGRETLPTLLF